MNRLSREKRIMVCKMLVEGSSLRSIERLVGYHRDTAMRLSVRMGEAARRFMDENIVDLRCRYLQLDEMWSYCFCKQRRTRLDDPDRAEKGDQFIFVALDSETKLIPSFEIGKRDARTTLVFLEDVAYRVPQRPQITTDAFAPYIAAIDLAYAGDVDYGQIIKVFGSARQPRESYSPPSFLKTHSSVIFGKPDKARISTSHIERQNLNFRLMMRRLTRLSLGFSKRLHNLKTNFALNVWWHNYGRPHRALGGASPAMAAGLESTFLEWEDLFAWGE